MKGKKQAYYQQFLQSKQSETDYFNRLIKAFKYVNNRVEDSVVKSQTSYAIEWAISGNLQYKDRFLPAGSCNISPFFDDDQKQVNKIVNEKFLATLINGPKRFYGGSSPVVDNHYLRTSYPALSEEKPVVKCWLPPCSTYPAFKYTDEKQFVPFSINKSNEPLFIDTSGELVNTDAMPTGCIIKRRHDIDEDIHGSRPRLVINDGLINDLHILCDELSKDNDRALRRLADAIRNRLRKYESTRNIYCILSIFNLVGQFKNRIEKIHSVFVSWKKFLSFFKPTLLRDIRGWFRKVIRFLFKNMEDSADHLVVFLERVRTIINDLKHYSNAATIRVRRNIYTTG